MELKARDGYGVRLLEGERDQARFEKLVDLSFGLEANQRFVSDFPVWAETTNPSVFKLGAFNGNELIGAVGLRVTCLKEYPKIRVGIIGAVCTHPEWRGKGVARTLIRLSEELAQDKEVSLLVLWSNQHVFYEKLGFGACGVQIQAPLEKVASKLQCDSSYKVIEGFDYGVFELMKKRPMGCELRNSDFQWMDSHQGTRWYRAEDADGTIVGYIAYEKGIDLKKIVHDWSGRSEAVVQLMRHLIQKDSDAQILFGLHHFREWSLEADESFQPSHLCMSKVLHPEKLFETFAQTAGVSVAKDVEGLWYFDTEVEKLGALKDSDLGCLFFGPQQQWKFLGGYLPVEFWFWGTDSA